MARRNKKTRVSVKPGRGAGTPASAVQAFLRQRPELIFLPLVVLLGILIYSNTFRVPFVFDDLRIIIENTSIRSFYSLVKDLNFSRIVGYFTIAANYKINGFGLAGYHVFNLSVHLINALIVFWFVSLTLKAPLFGESRTGDPGFKKTSLIIALFSSLLFVAHPLQTQAVTYIVQRFTSLSTLFFLLSLVMYIKWRYLSVSPQPEPEKFRIEIGVRGRKIIFYTISLVAAILAVGAKEIAFTLPLVMVLWEFSFCGGRENVKKRLMGLAPFFLTLPLVPLSLLSSKVPLFTAPGDTEPPPALSYLYTQFRVVVTYLRLLFFPSGQNLDYDYPVYDSPGDPNVFLSLLFLALVVGLGVLLYRRSAKKKNAALLRLAGFGIFWFFITLSVESSVISIADVIFEHRLYLPSIGFFITVTTGIVAGAAAIRQRLPWVNRAVVAALILVVVVLAVTAYERNKVWQDKATIWEDAVRKSPGKARPHNNLGTVYAERGEHDRAEKEFEQAILLRPNFADAHDNMGLIYSLRGEYDKAEKEYELAVSYWPTHANAHNNLGLMYARRGEHEKAIHEFALAISSKPGYVTAYNNLGLSYQELGDYDMSEEMLLVAVTLDSNFSEAYYNLGMTYVHKQRYADAIGPFLKTVELDPGNFGARINLGNIYAIQGRYDKALVEYKAALAINPDYQEAKDNIQLIQSMQSGTGAGGR